MEVLDSKIEDKWFVRTLTSSPEAGWIPSIVLEPMSREEVDGKGKLTITSGEGGRKRSRGGLDLFMVG